MNLEIIAILIIGIFGLVLILSYIFNIFKIKFEKNVYTNKEEFLKKLQEFINNCLNECKKYNKKIICNEIEYKGEKIEKSEIENILKNVEIKFDYLENEKLIISCFNQKIELEKVSQIVK